MQKDKKQLKDKSNTQTYHQSINQSITNSSIRQGAKSVNTWIN